MTDDFEKTVAQEIDRVLENAKAELEKRGIVVHGKSDAEIMEALKALTRPH